MLYSNVAATSYSGELFIGDPGPLVSLMRVRSDDGVVLKAGMNYSYNISFKKYDDPIVIRDLSPDVCLLLSAYGIPSFKFPGSIHIIAKHKPQLDYKTSKGSLVDISWPCAVISVPDKLNTVIQICEMGGCCEPQLLLVPREKTNSVFPCTIDTLEEQCKRLNIDVPCRIIKNDQGEVDFEKKFVLDPSEWIDL